MRREKAAKIRRLRASRLYLSGMTMAQVATELGVHRKTVSRWFHEQSRAKANTNLHRLTPDELDLGETVSTQEFWSRYGW